MERQACTKGAATQHRTGRLDDADGSGRRRTVQDTRAVTMIADTHRHRQQQPIHIGTDNNNRQADPTPNRQRTAAAKRRLAATQETNQHEVHNTNLNTRRRQGAGDATRGTPHGATRRPGDTLWTPTQPGIPTTHQSGAHAPTPASGGGRHGGHGRRRPIPTPTPRPRCPRRCYPRRTTPSGAPRTKHSAPQPEPAPEKP